MHMQAASVKRTHHDLKKFCHGRVYPSTPNHNNGSFLRLVSLRVSNLKIIRGQLKISKEGLSMLSADCINYELHLHEYSCAEHRVLHLSTKEKYQIIREEL